MLKPSFCLGTSYTRPEFGEVLSKQRAAPSERWWREEEITHLVQLCKNWRKAFQPEREGLKVRGGQAKAARCIRKCTKRKQKERHSFFKDPFKHTKQLLEEKKSGELETTRRQMEQHVKQQYSDLLRNVPLGTPGYVPRLVPLTAKFDIMAPKLSEFRDTVKKARFSSAQGPNGVPKVLEVLRYPSRTARRKPLVPPTLVLLAGLGWGGSTTVLVQGLP